MNFKDAQGFFGGSIGADAALKILATTQQTTFLGTGDDRLGRQVGLNLTGGRRYQYGKGAEQAGQNLAPFLSDPLMGQRFADEVTGEGTINDRDIIGATIFSGPERALAATRSLKRRDLAKVVQEFNAQQVRSNLEIQTTGFESSSAQSQFARTMATGVSIQSREAQGAAQGVETAMRAQIAAVQHNIEELKKYDDGSGRVRNKLREQEGALSQLQAAAQSFAQSLHQQTVQFGTQKIGTQVGITALRYEAAQYGLTPGTLNPLQAEEERGHRAQLADAVRRSRDMQLSAQERLEASGQAEQMRQTIRIGDARQRLIQQFVTPAQAASGFLGRELTQETQAALYDQTIPQTDRGFAQVQATAGRNLNRQQALLGATQAAFNRREVGYDQVEQARNAVVEAQMQMRQVTRQRIGMTLGRELMESEGSAGRFGAFVAQRGAFGATEEEMAGLTRQSLMNLRGTMSVAGREFGALQRARAITPEEANARMNAQEARRLQAQALERDIVRLPAEGEIRRAGISRIQTDANVAFGLSMGLGPQTDLALNQQSVGSILRQRNSLLARANLRQNPVQDEADRAQASVLGSQAAISRLSALGTFRTSARDQVALGTSALAINLAENDIGYGGQVPMALRRQYIGQIGSQIGQIQNQISQAPEGPARDATRAALFPQFAQLMQERQQQQNALQFGDIGHLINMSVGATGDFTMFGPNLREFQQMNPGGSRALGGSGASVGTAMSFGMGFSAPTTAAQLLGGAGANNEVVSAIQELTAALNANTNSPRGTANGNPTGQTYTRPQDAARDRANGMVTR
jgi:hypothetical protein